MIIKTLAEKKETEILARLEQAGYEGYFVGGCVREAVIRELRGGGSDEAQSHSYMDAADADTDVEADIASAQLLPDIRSTDTDIATNASPEQVKAVFSDMAVIDTGIKHGTVTVLFPVSCEAENYAAAENQAADELLTTKESDSHLHAHGEVSKQDAARDSGIHIPEQCISLHSAGIPESAKPGFNTSVKRIPVEITTYRIDGEYVDNRHPESVEFTSSLDEDLARRDFTVNAMASDRHGNIRDPFGGIRDIEAGIIRAVGNPEKRFREDGLRIMRALRFASVLGYTIEKETSQALKECRRLLNGIAAERIFAEFCRLVTGRGAGDVLREYTDVAGTVIPELLAMKGFKQNNPYHRYDVLEHCIRAMEAVETDAGNRVYMKIAALFHDIGKPETYSEDENGIGHFYGHPAVGAAISRRIMQRFRADSFTADRLCTIVKYHDLVFEKDRKLLKRWMNRFGSDVLFEILAIKKADNFATGNMERSLRCKFEEIGEMMRTIIDEQQCFTLKNLAVNGRDIIESGIKPGPEVGHILDRLLDDVINEKLPNERDVLLKHIRSISPQVRRNLT